MVNFSYFAFGIIYFFITERYRNDREKKALAQEKVNAELAFLNNS